jgi:ABC-type glycerol-3-phosphate transport system substrate-binding protein
LSWKYDHGTTKDGKLLGYGTDIRPLAMCYRKDMLQAAGQPSDPESVDPEAERAPALKVIRLNGLERSGTGSAADGRQAFGSQRGDLGQFQRRQRMPDQPAQQQVGQRRIAG